MPHIAHDVRTLAEAGLFDEEIAEKLQEETGQEVRPSYIKKILARRSRRGRPLEVGTQIEWVEKMQRAADTDHIKSLLQLLRDALEGRPTENEPGPGVETTEGRGIE